jgi:hypothetical protein
MRRKILSNWTRNLDPNSTCDHGTPLLLTLWHFSAPPRDSGVASGRSQHEAKQHITGLTAWQQEPSKVSKNQLVKWMKIGKKFVRHG